MKNIQDNPLGESEVNKTDLYFARLMTPAQVNEATKDRPPFERLKYEGNWVFCGDVGAAMFEPLRSVPRSVPFRLSGFKSTSAGAYGVLTHQIEHHQHRFLIPLFEPSVITCIAALRTQPHSFLFGNDSQNDCVLLKGEMQGASFQPLLGLCQPWTLNKAREELLYLPNAISAMTDPVRVPSLSIDHAVRAVSLSVLMPSATIAWVRDAARRGDAS